MRGGGRLVASIGCLIEDSDPPMRNLAIGGVWTNGATRWSTMSRSMGMPGRWPEQPGRATMACERAKRVAAARVDRSPVWRCLVGGPTRRLQFFFFHFGSGVMTIDRLVVVLSNDERFNHEQRSVESSEALTASAMSGRPRCGRISRLPWAAGSGLWADSKAGRIVTQEASFRS